MAQILNISKKTFYNIIILEIIESFITLLLGISLFVFFITCILGVVVLTLKWLLYTFNLIVMVFSLFVISIIYMYRFDNKYLKLTKTFCIISFILVSIGIVTSFFDFLTIFNFVIVYFSFLMIYVDTLFSIITYFFIGICLIINIVQTIRTRVFDLRNNETKVQTN
ncbi:MAG: hypothetical protein LBB39_01575 [Mycoplasmataceae bacterium]|jgi:hypothetical protein|nr:hypothetical protein [Mycoplasmataceae bacterium]